jgi:hypothetical protein
MINNIFFVLYKIKHHTLNFIFTIYNPIKEKSELGFNSVVGLSIQEALNLIPSTKQINKNKSFLLLETVHLI